MSPLMSKKDVAALLQVSERTVSRLLAGGRLASVRVGGQVRVRREDVETYLATQQTALYTPQADPIVDGEDFVNGFTALVPAERPPEGAYAIELWSCSQSNCPVREVVVKGRAPAGSSLRCPACRGRLHLVGHLDELLLVPVKGAGVKLP